MSKVIQTYNVIHNQTREVVATKTTRDAARAVYSLVGGAANGYTLEQQTTVTVIQKIR